VAKGQVEAVKGHVGAMKEPAVVEFGGEVAVGYMEARV
jgi:hypothetical protein